MVTVAVLHGTGLAHGCGGGLGGNGAKAEHGEQAGAGESLEVHGISPVQRWGWGAVLPVESHYTPATYPLCVAKPLKRFLLYLRSRQIHCNTILRRQA
ncbi:hypothetical protein D3C79_746980 [compost metagenome]